MKLYEQEERLQLPSHFHALQSTRTATQCLYSRTNRLILFRVPLPGKVYAHTPRDSATPIDDLQLPAPAQRLTVVLFPNVEGPVRRGIQFGLTVPVAQPG